MYRGWCQGQAGRRAKRCGDSNASRSNDVAKLRGSMHFGGDLFDDRDPLVNPQATFLRRFGDLVALLRGDPGNDAAQDLALTAVGASVAHGPVRVEVEVEKSEPPEPLSLQARLLARRIDSIEVSPDADLSDLLTLARALAHDTMVLPASPHIKVALIPPLSHDDPEPPSAPPSSNIAARKSRRPAERRAGGDRRCAPQSRWSGGVERRRRADRRLYGERRLVVVENLWAEATQSYENLAHASRHGAPERILEVAHRLARLAPRVPQAERRVILTRVRQVLRRPGIDVLIDRAERDPTLRLVAGEVFRWLGLTAAEAMIDRLRASPVLGPRGFLLDALGRMPEAYPLVAPLLRSGQPHEIRYGAMLAARLDRAEAAPLLKTHLDHPDEEVRVAVVQALGHLHHARVADALRATLQHPSPTTRSAAADAIADWRAGALGVLLGAALETERNRRVWNALVEALGRIGSSSACATLAAVALRRRSLFRRHGYTRDQRLAAVAALARAKTPVALTTLQRLATEADPDVRAQAREAFR
jgi:hypothetical protein